GKDARDVLHEQGPEGIGRVIMAASEGGDGSDGPPIPSPCSLPELVLTHPVMRAAVISGLLRMGETMNLVAAPKKGKSWLVYDLGLSVASGCRWLETFPCVQGRVLILDAELHPEVIAHRLPAVAEALGIAPEWLGWIDILPLRGLGVDLLRLESFIETIEAGRYALIILDAWYRFLPLGYSENDNAQVMALYNKIDTYAARLGAAWVNIHHASKGDQSGKGTTDVGSGAGSQSRAADTHLIICAHEQDDVSVIEAVVRSWPPVEPIAIRWTFPVWQLDTTADPRRLQKPRERANQESRGTRLDGDRQLIVNAMVHNPDLQTKTDIRDSSGFGNPRFGFAWASLLADKTIIPSGEVIKGNNRKYESFILLHKETEE
ncbi:MAG: AAA family ATPase, partial [Candidatus Sumerlaeota bacterium]|nr:AAA family ATPase [Candidatus Sumerlaeota bacterium]